MNQIMKRGVKDLIINKCDDKSQIKTIIDFFEDVDALIAKCDLLEERIEGLVGRLSYIKCVAED